MDRLSIIIPTINEAGNINDLFKRIFEVGDTQLPGIELEVIVVDDDSTDGTREQVRQWATEHRIKLIHRQKDKGLASAVFAGAESSTGDIILVMDADLSHPPESIPDLLRPILAGKKDMVVGSRYVPGGCTPGWSLARVWISRLAALPARVLTDILDPLSGFFAVKKDTLLSLDRNVPGFKIGLALLVRADGLKIGEVPITFQDRRNGHSKLTLQVACSYCRQLFELAGGNISRRTGFRFALVGILGMLIDFLVFQGLFLAGAGMGPANTISFAAAAVSNYCLNRNWAFAVPKREWAMPAPNGLLFIGIALLALFFRGGVLALLAGSWHWPVSLALAAAIFSAAIINYLGSAFLVFPSSAHSPEMRWRILAVLILGYTVALRLVFMGLPELLHEEAYYWNYGQHLALSYLDHPPLLAWLIRISTELLGTSEWSVRLVAFVSWMITAVFCFQTAWAMYDRSTAFRVLILVSVLPAFFCTGFLSTPDAPLIACWAATLFFLSKALIQEQARSWYGVGLGLGLGMLSKYTIALLVPSICIFLLLHRDSRKWLTKPEPYIGAGLALLIFSPVIIWNAENNWVSFVFQGPRRVAGGFSFSLPALIGSVLLLLTPAGLLSAAAFLKGKLWSPELWMKEKAGRSQTLFSLVFTLMPFAVFFFFSLFRQVKLNWTAPVWLAVLPFMASTMAAGSGLYCHRLLSVVQRSWPATILGTLMILGAVLYHAVLGFPGLPYPGDQPFLLDWHYLASHIEDLEDRLETELNSPLVVGLDKYRIASGLAFYRTKILEKKHIDPTEGVQETAGRNFFCKSSLMYAFWFPAEKYAGRDMILVSEDFDDLKEKKVTGSFMSMGDIRKIHLVKNKKPVTSYYYRLGRNYLPPERQYVGKQEERRRYRTKEAVLEES
jgi:dolichol-phosphate mannosyltransferase